VQVLLVTMEDVVPTLVMIHLNVDVLLVTWAKDVKFKVTFTFLVSHSKSKLRNKKSCNIIEIG
jgi:hypothetical protein